MAICDKCKKTPLEMRELNEVTSDKGQNKVLCDDCYLELFKLK